MNGHGRQQTPNMYYQPTCPNCEKSGEFENDLNTCDSCAESNGFTPCLNCDVSCEGDLCEDCSIDAMTTSKAIASGSWQKVGTKHGETLYTNVARYGNRPAIIEGFMVNEHGCSFRTRKANGAPGIDSATILKYAKADAGDEYAKAVFEGDEVVIKSPYGNFYRAVKFNSNWHSRLHVVSKHVTFQDAVNASHALLRASFEDAPKETATAALMELQARLDAKKERL